MPHPLLLTDFIHLFTNLYVDAVNRQPWLFGPTSRTGMNGCQKQIKYGHATVIKLKWIFGGPFFHNLAAYHHLNH